ncbi:hypothetical protein ASPFODRAFT_708890 [Aspergillus luchuensis CBS 106.47]|uniref:Carboxylic ester hydrolase n=1 Tax=Aspergillus luchuensis (strain CBS 106.47) TaxID=1137211 RepID=A0A1M3T055_ASPLC|nr:hypothetical protein ASPFODRAFT_708890 [Aspergillus luchuensis CBS 106.47]
MECIGYGSDQKGYLQSEDCLYLNVVRPAGYDSPSLPVLVYSRRSMNEICGGFARGGTPDLRYNVTVILEHSVNIGQQIIALSIAYRLGPWRFFNGVEFAHEGSLNLGLKDQRLALHWVKENIAGFGGDPNKVVIYGRSAGSESVGYHVRAYNGRDDVLFRGGMMESGAVLPGSALKLTWTHEPWFQKIADEAGCFQAICKLDCLRRMPFTVLNNILNTTANDTTPYNWRPTLDGDFVAQYPSEQLDAGDLVKVPKMIGYTTDEGTTELPGPVNTTAELKEYLSSTTTYGWALDDRVVSELFKLYPNNTSLGIPSSEELGGNVTFPQTYGAAFRQIAAYHGDAQFIAATRYTCELWAAHNLTAYCYRFNTKTGDYNWEEGVAHFSDVISYSTILMVMGSVRTRLAMLQRAMLILIISCPAHGSASLIVWILMRGLGAGGRPLGRRIGRYMILRTH